MRWQIEARLLGKSTLILAASRSNYNAWLASRFMRITNRFASPPRGMRFINILSFNFGSNYKDVS
ncbi:hypothetical protein AXG89_34075 [Burkholderia sp. PAMC 26561]|nr:hypothetical protein AXG89_34075 [Burkholderia sp. PAMC 26561]